MAHKSYFKKRKQLVKKMTDIEYEEMLAFQTEMDVYYFIINMLDELGMINIMKELEIKNSNLMKLTYYYFDSLLAFKNRLTFKFQYDNDRKKQRIYHRPNMIVPFLRIKKAYKKLKFKRIFKIKVGLFFGSNVNKIIKNSNKG